MIAPITGKSALCHGISRPPRPARRLGRRAFVEKATGLWSLSVTDTVTGLRELSGYPQPTGARRARRWKVGIRPGRIRPAPSRDYAPCAHAPQKSRKPRSGMRWLLPFRNLDPS